MSDVLLVIGSALLIHFVIWMHLGANGLGDPEEDSVKEFYARYPRIRWYVLISNRLWLPLLVAGVVLIVGSLFLGER